MVMLLPLFTFVMALPALAQDTTIATEMCPPAIAEAPVETPMAQPPLLKDREAALAAIAKEGAIAGSHPAGSYVLLWFLIDTAGRVAKTAVAQSSGDAAVDGAAQRAAQTFQWLPAEDAEGNATCVWVRLPVRFPDAGGASVAS